MAEDRAINAWLTSTGVDLTAAQRERFADGVNAYELTASGRGEAGPGRCDGATAAAWVSAFEVVRGEMDLNARGRAYRAAQDAAHVGAVIAVLAGMSEAEAAGRGPQPPPPLYVRL
ncbi:hypothetical protein [Antribacter gilvus]|uniref:hypothetical protein n=1 Tax=Antribacter gilvus TaxID=2304675 RepID=UPI000F7A35A9|nr:hypothetical protein [Antribacter gilvus]